MTERKWKLKKLDGTFMRSRLTGDDMTLPTHADAVRTANNYLLTGGYSYPVLLERVTPPTPAWKEVWPA